MLTAIVIALIASQGSGLETDAACIVGQTATEIRSSLAGEALAGSAGPALASVREAGSRCGGASQSEDHQRRAQALAIALMLREDLARRLAEAGIPVAAIDSWFERQSAEARVEPRVPPALAMQMFEALQREGVVAERIEAQVAPIGLYLGARITAERMRSGLPIDL